MYSVPEVTTNSGPTIQLVIFRSRKHFWFDSRSDSIVSVAPGLKHPTSFTSCTCPSIPQSYRGHCEKSRISQFNREQRSFVRTDFDRLWMSLGVRDSEPKSNIKTIHFWCPCDRGNESLCNLMERPLQKNIYRNASFLWRRRMNNVNTTTFDGFGAVRHE